MKANKVKKNIFFGLLIFLLFSCSSAPKRAMEITVIQTAANTALETANSNILTGDFLQAKTSLDAAFLQAMSIDNLELLIAIDLARVSMVLSQDPPDLDAAKKIIEEAKSFVPYTNNPTHEKALCALGEVRIKLFEATESSYSEVLSILDQNAEAIKDDPYNKAHFHSVRGDVLKNQKKYAEAEIEYLAAEKIYIDERYLAEIGLTWYKIAQVRSLGGNKNSALAALEQAIYYDKAAENIRALGTDYYVKGIILTKGNPTEIEKKEALYAFNHSADIFNAAGYVDLAQRSRSYAEKTK